MRSAVILTALPVEFDAVAQHVQPMEEIVHPKGTVYRVGIFESANGGWKVALAEIGPGNAGAAAECERAIEYFRATHAFFVGVAGGIKDVELGDVVAATRIYGFEFGKADDDFLPRPDVGESSYELVQRARAVARDKLWQASVKGVRSGEPRALVGPIAAGEKVVVSRRSAAATTLRQFYSDAVAVEMEGRGFLRAAHATTGLRALVIRGISDLLENKTVADSGGWQVVAARNAAAFAFAVLAGLPPESDSQSTGSRQGASEREAWWKELWDQLVTLYPLGPLDRNVWARAGGDVSALETGGNGRDAWYSALRLVRLGGGRTSAVRLLEVARTDYSDNQVVQSLLRRIA